MMKALPDEDNRPVIGTVRIAEPVSHKAFNATAKNGHQLIAVVPLALAHKTPAIKPGDMWLAQFTPYDLSTARLIEEAPHSREEGK